MSSYPFVETAESRIIALSRPRKQDFMTTWWYSDGAVVAKKVGDNVPEYTSDLMKDENLTIIGLNKEYPVFEKKLDDKAFRKAQKDYREKVDAINVQFELDLADYLGISANHPKWYTLMNLATNYASSGNKNTIVEVAEELSELLS